MTLGKKLALSASLAALMSGGAAGFQIRRESYAVDPNDLADLDVTPGPGGTGPYAFLAGTN